VGHQNLRAAEGLVASPRGRLGQQDTEQDHHKAAAQLDTADSDIHQEGQAACHTVAVHTKSHNLADNFEEVRLGKRFAYMDSNDHLESADAHSSNFPAAVHSDTQSWANEEDGSAFLVAVTKSCMNAVDCHRFLPLLPSLGFGSRSRLSPAFFHVLLGSRGHGCLCCRPLSGYCLPLRIRS
jgi:hypothetical protein